MAKLHILFILVSSRTLIFAGTGKSTITTSVPTKFARVYLHTFLSGPNKTAYEVARASIMTPPRELRDGESRERPYDERARHDHWGQVVGRAESLIEFSGRTEAAALLHLEFMFQNGIYNASSLSLLGRARMVKDMTEEVSIVGGTAQFRAARDYAVPYMYSYDPVVGYLIYVYDLHVYPN